MGKKFIIVTILLTMCLCLLSYSSNNKIINQNKKELENLLSSLVIKNKSSSKIDKKYKTNINEIIIDNSSELDSIISEANVDYNILINNLVTKMFNFNEEYANIFIDDTKIEILNFKSFSYLINNNENSIYSTKKSRKNFNNSVDFTGININPTTCRWVNEKFVSFADKMVGRYSGLAGITYLALKLGAPSFVAKCTSLIASIIAQFTNWLNTLGPWGTIIRLVLVVFSTLAAIIITHIIWAGANNKGFKMGLEWEGFFKAKWVYSFYD